MGFGGDWGDFVWVVFGAEVGARFVRFQGYKIEGYKVTGLQGYRVVVKFGLYTWKTLIFGTQNSKLPLHPYGKDPLAPVRDVLLLPFLFYPWVEYQQKSLVEAEAV